MMLPTECPKNARLATVKLYTDVLYVLQTVGKIDGPMSHSQYSGINTAIQKIYWLTTYAAKISIKLNGIFNHVQPEGSQDCQCPQR